MSYHETSCLVMSCYAMSYDVIVVMFCSVILVISYDALTCNVICRESSSAEIAANF